MEKCRQYLHLTENWYIGSKNLRSSLTGSNFKLFRLNCDKNYNKGNLSHEFRIIQHNKFSILPCFLLTRIFNVIYDCIRLDLMSKISHIICNFCKEIIIKLSHFNIRTFLLMKSLEFYIKQQTGKNSAQTQHVFCINFAILFAFLM